MYIQILESHMENYNLAPNISNNVLNKQVLNLQ